MARDLHPLSFNGGVGQNSGMKNLHHTRFDLNLVKVFLTIWDNRSLTGAGARLGLTQPAVSHALRRLREQFSDPLFLRVGNQMEPTEVATRLREPFEQALSLLEQTIHDTHSFAPETATRRFRIAMSDTGEFYAMPRILAALEQAAPNANLSSVRIDPAEIESALRSGQVDLALGFLPDLEAGRCTGNLLFHDRLVVLMREGHPALDGDWSEETLARLSFIDVSRAATGFHLVRETLERKGLNLGATARLEHFTVLPEVVRQTDFVAIFPNSIHMRLKERGGFAVRELPFDLPAYAIKLWVHDSFATDPGLTWFRALIETALTAKDNET